MIDLKGLGKINVQNERAKRSMLDFALAVNENYRANWHHKLLCRYLDDFFEGRIKRLMVFMPPQHGKSELTSRIFPAYILGRKPQTKVVMASHGADLAERMNRDVQRFMDSPNYAEIFPNTKLPTQNNAGYHVRNTQQFDILNYGGFLKAVGVGGSLTGTPADLGIIDDPHKDMADAQSPIIQEKIWDWYNTVFCTRLHNDSGVLLIQTRWDSNDLAGRILAKMEEGIANGDENVEMWTILNLPAIKENDDFEEDPRKIGEALWPERHNLKRLLARKKQDPRGFQHLFQQNPQPVQAGGEAYNQFQRETVIRSLQYDPDLPLHVTFDFNTAPYMSCGVWQVEKWDIGNDTRYTAKLIREICLKSPRANTRAVCAEIRRLYPDHAMGLYVYGDPNGFKEDTRSDQGYNDFTIILGELKGYNPVLRVFKKAPAVKKRIEFMNALFAGGYDGLEIAIDENCFRAIDDFQFVKEDLDGTKLKQKLRDPITGVQCEKYGHMSDNTEYFICHAFNNRFTKHMNAGRVGTYKIGVRAPRNKY